MAEFEAVVERGGWGSFIKVGGVELPELTSFTISADVERNRLDVSCLSAGKVIGSVDAINVAALAYVTLDAEGKPVEAFGEIDRAEATGLTFVEVPLSLRVEVKA